MPCMNIDSIVRQLCFQTEHLDYTEDISQSTDTTVAKENNEMMHLV